MPKIEDLHFLYLCKISINDNLGIPDNSETDTKYDAAILVKKSRKLHFENIYTDCAIVNHSPVV